MVGTKKQEYKLKLANKLDAIIKDTHQRFLDAGYRKDNDGHTRELYTKISIEYNLLVDLRDVLKLNILEGRVY